MVDRKSTRLNSSHTEISTLSLHDALPILSSPRSVSSTGETHHEPSRDGDDDREPVRGALKVHGRSEEHTPELQSHRDLHSFPPRRSSDLIVSSICFVNRGDPP